MDYWGQYLTSRTRITAPGNRLSQAMETARALHPAATTSNVHPITEPAVVDITPRYEVDEAEGPERDFGLGARWGAHWRDAAQGWAGDEGTWRPIVTTTTTFEDWDIDTYLGVVSGEATARIDVTEDALGTVLEQARLVAMGSLVDSAVTRGAHAVVACELDYTPIDHRMIVTVTGTAVTLKES
ncbi:MAG: heavy metal-binding domain-containing protein [Acidimicrobiia bacterium]